MLLARDVLGVLKIFLPFLQKKNERIFFFFLIFLTNDRPNGRTDQTDFRFILSHGQEEAFRLKHHFIIESEHFPRAHVLLSSERSAS